MGFLDFISNLEDKLQGIPDEVGRIVEHNADEILQLRKDEILLGRNSDGEPFTPGYLNDPYFKSPAAAIAYADRKYKLRRAHDARIRHVLNYPNKDDDTPNLRVTGPFQDSMFIRPGKESFIIGSTYEDAPMIDAKYGGKVYDLAQGAKYWLWENILLNRLIIYLHGM